MNDPDIPQYRAPQRGPVGDPGPGEEPPRFAKLKTATIGILVVGIVNWLLNVAAVLSGAMHEATLRLMDGFPGGEMFSEAEKQSMTEDAGRLSIPQEVTTLIMTGGVFALIYLGLRARKNWARLLGIVLAFVSIGVSLLSNVFAVLLNIQMGAIGVVSMLVVVVWLTLLVYWLVLAFSREVKLYFAPPRLP
ncbi:hypothetical protein [Rothia halotolerans]|uniref:hypothetical protein n=1 Tax=Rothia halotolerans TaxID=405770 RepID=UPI00101C600B|nr:hypothetical protein [Rothia halotolerans]